jgi:PAS domain S-box-containing protein
LAFVFVGGILIIRNLLPVDFSERPVMILFILPVIFSAFIGGIGPGVAATILASLFTAYYMPPSHKFLINSRLDLFQWVTFIIEGLVISSISEWLHHMRRSKRDRVIQLESTNTALQRSEEKYRNLLDNLPQRIFIKDRNSVYISCNELYAQDHGIPANEIAGMTDHDLHPKELVEQYRIDDARIMNSGITEAFEEKYTHNGKNIWVYIIKTPIFDKDSNVVGILGIFSDVTEKKQAEEIIRAREQYLEAILHTTAEGFLMLNNEGTIIDVNEAYCSMSGYSKQELLGLKAESIIADEDLTVIYSRIKHLQTEGSELFEARHRRKDGSVWPVEVSITWLNEYGGRVICFFRDLTERNRSQQELLHSYNLMRYIIEHASSGIAILDNELRYLYASHRFQSEFKITDKNIIGKQHYEIFPDLPQKWHDVHKRALAGEILRADKDTYKRVDGSVDYTRWECRPWYRSDSSVGGIILYTEIITDRVSAEEELRKNEEHLRAIISVSPIAIVTMDQEGVIQSWNAAAERIFGWSETEAIGTILPYVDKAQSESSREMRNRVLNGKTFEKLKISRYKKDGSVLQLNISTTLIPNKKDKSTSILAIYEDITNLKKTEAERAILQEQLMQSQKMESIGRLAGGVAHDFNNKLGVILGYTELALNKIGPDSAIREHLSQISLAAQRSAEITKQLLAFARKQTITPKILDINETIKGMIKMLQRLIGEDIELKWLPGNNLWQIMIDPTQLDQVLANLCVNARDAINENGRITIETGKVTIDAGLSCSKSEFRPGDFVTLTVSDNGCGMDKEMIEILFEPFYTTKEVGKGTGLGLATVYGIVKQNNGFINVYSEPGQGTTFKIYLPACITADPEQCSIDPSKELQVAAGHEKILLVEDESSVLEVTKTMLEMLGYSVLPADSPAKAIELAKSHNYQIDLLMTDVIMPEMNGNTLVKKIKKTYPDIKQLFMSGYTSDVIGHHGVLDEDMYFIQKPFSIKDLALKVRQALEK